MPWYLLLGCGAVFSVAVMISLWFFVGRKGSAGVVDVAWASLIGLMGIGYALGGDGNVGRRWLAAVLISLWALRLAIHIGSRLTKEKEDPRYTELKKQWGGNATIKLLLFYLIQAAAAIGFSIPVLIASVSKADLGISDLLGCLIWLVALSGETLADRQLKRFKESNTDSQAVCDRGLWKYSRHPNYFFEWLHWFSYVLLCWQHPWGWLTVIAPLVMLYFILFVTGIPPTEKQALKSRPKSYRDYQRTTSPFFPWPPQSPAA